MAYLCMKRVLGALLLGIVATSWTTDVAFGVDVERSGTFKYKGNELPYFVVRGRIHTGDTLKVRQALDLASVSIGPTAFVSLNSPGGDMQEGIELGKFFADNAVATLVRRGQACESACALAFLGGRSFWPTGGVGFYMARYLEPGARLGFHSPTFEVPELEALAAKREFLMPIEMARISIQTLARYMANAGVDAKAIIDILSTPHNKMYEIKSSNDLVRFNLNVTPITIPTVDVKAAVHSACEKMLAVLSTGGLDESNLEVISAAGADAALLGFGIMSVPYVMLGCGVRLTEEETAEWRDQRLTVDALEERIRGRIALLNEDKLDASVSIEIVATEGIDGLRSVSTLYLTVDGWSSLDSNRGNAKVASMNSLSYWLIPENVPLNAWPIRKSDDWGQ